MNETARWIRVISVFVLVMSAQNIERLADAIHRAEGNDNYGILTKYKVTTPRQACINTINHALRDYNGSEDGFISFLGSRYAPIGVANDPTNLNVNWIPNVTKLYNQKAR